MNEDICRIIGVELSKRVKGYVNISIRTDIQDGHDYVVAVVNFGSYHWKWWYKEKPVYEYFNDGGTVDKMVDEIVNKYRGWLNYTCVTKVFFKEAVA